MQEGTEILDGKDLIHITSSIAAIRFSKTNDNRPHVDLVVDKIVTIDFLVDCGASRSCIDIAQIPQTSRKKIKYLLSEVALSAANGSQINIVGEITLNLKLGSRYIDWKFCVVRGLSRAGSAILGWDFLWKYTIIKKDHLALTFNNAAIQFKQEIESTPLRTMGKTVIAPRSALMLKLRGGKSIVNAMTSESCIAGLTVFPALISFQENNEVFVAAANYTDKPILMKRNRIVTAATQVDEEVMIPLEQDNIAAFDLEQYKLDSDDTKPPIKGPLTQLTADEKRFWRDKFQLGEMCKKENVTEKYLDLLLQYTDVCSKDKYDIGHVKVMPARIRMKTEEPIYVKQFRLPLAHQQEIRDYCEKLLKAGVLENSQSPYNAPVFGVVKKGSNPEDKNKLNLRVVLDYRKLNDHMINETYVLRDIRDLIDSIGLCNGRVKTSLDLTSGFWSQELEPASRKYTAFTIPGMTARLQWTRASMGIKNSPSSFASLVDYAMRGTNSLRYMDDLLTISANHDQHLKDLEEVLLRFRRYGFKLNLNKSTFATDTVTYLGFIIDEKGIRPSHDKCEALKSAAVPKTITEIRRFAGCANYFREMIPNFSIRMAPLLKLTSPKSGWSPKTPLPDEAVKAFHDIKNALCSSPIISLPLPKAEFRVTTDASLGSKEAPGGYGAMLSQLDDSGKERVIAYASKTLNKAEQNYSAFLAEAAAANWAIEHWHPYLYGKHFTLFCDHKPLSLEASTTGNASSKANAKRTYSRLTQNLLKYNFTVEYRKGVDNAVADFLSRKTNIDIKEEKPGMISPLAAINMVFNNDIAKEQQTDTKLKDVYTYVQNGNLPMGPKSYQQWVSRIGDKCMIDDDNVLYYNLVQEKRRPRWCVYVPESMQQRVVFDCHVALENGHAGNFRTTEKIKEYFWFPGISNAVAQYIKECAICQAANGKKIPPVPLRPLELASRPNQLIHIDLFGPIKSSTSGNAYLCCMTDSFSKYTVLVPIPSKDATTVATAILEHWIYKFSIMEMICSDKGKEFDCEILKDLCKLLQVDKITTSPYCPWSNGKIERFNKSIINYVTKMLDYANKHSLEWEPLIAPLAFAHNCAVNRTTKETPFFLTFLRDPKLVCFEQIKPKRHTGTFQEETLNQMYNSFKLVRENSSEAQGVMKAYFDRTAKERNYEVGDVVMLHLPIVKPGTNKKFQNFWKPFWVISDVISPVNYEITNLQDKKKKLNIHVNRLKTQIMSQAEKETYADAITKIKADHAEREKYRLERMPKTVRKHFETSEEAVKLSTPSKNEMVLRSGRIINHPDS